MEKLERKLHKTSQNSHQPPSSDPPAVKEQTKRARPKSGKQGGGQKDHKRSVRDLLPTDLVDDVHEPVPTECSGCGHALQGPDPDPVRHQVTELPVLRPAVTEYRLHALECAYCGKTTRTPLPLGVPKGAFGPRLITLVAMLTAH